MNSDEAYVQFKNDVATLKKFVVREDVLKSEVRAIASPIVRRWLTDDNLFILQRDRRVKFKFDVCDIRKAERYLEKKPAYLFAACNCSLRGIRIAHLMMNSEPPGADPLGGLEFNEVELHAVRKARVLHHLGSYATREEVIKYAANKDGGVHLDFSRSKDVERFLDKVRRLGGYDLRNPDKVVVTGLAPGSSRVTQQTLEDDLVFDLVSLEVLSSAEILCSVKEVAAK